MMKHYTWQKRLLEGPKHGQPWSKRKKPQPPLEIRRAKKKAQRKARKVTQAMKRKKK